MNRKSQTPPGEAPQKPDTKQPSKPKKWDAAEFIEQFPDDWEERIDKAVVPFDVARAVNEKMVAYGLIAPTEESPSGQCGTENSRPAGGGARRAVACSSQKQTMPEDPTAAEQDRVHDNRVRLIREYGEPFIANEGKARATLRINERFMAGRLATEAWIVRDPEAEEFFSYDARTGLWGPLSENMLAADAGGLINQELDLAGKSSLRAMVSGRQCREVVGFAKAFAEQRGFFELKPDVIVAQNTALRVTADGVVQEPFSPDHRARVAVPAAYDPTAECPRTDDELIGLNFEPEDAEVFWKYLGLVVLGRNLVQRMVIIHGETAGTGKSIAVQLAGIICGRNTSEVRPHMLDERFEMARYVGKSLLTGPDIKGGFLNTAGAQKLKAMVGGDQIQPEDKHLAGANSPSIKGQWPIILTSNVDLFVFADTDTSAWRRRLIWLETTGKTPTKKIPDFEEVLWREEGAGILRRAVDGLVAVLKDIRETGDIRLHPPQVERVDRLLGQSNSVREFFDNGGGLEFGRGLDASEPELEDGYFAYCKRRGWAPVPSHRQRLRDAATQRHLTPSNSIMRAGKATRGFRGVGVGLVLE
jgi:putative DNA primase/helicase